MKSLKIQTILLKLIRKDSFIWKNLERAYSLNYIINYLFHYRTKATTTREIYLEFVSYCNLRCPMCSLDHTKPKKRMTTEILEKLFDELYLDRRFRKVKIIHLHNAGEVLLHPEFEEMILVIKKAKQKFQDIGYNFPKIALLTNASLLKGDKAKFILEVNVFDFIRFSMDGGTPEAFEIMRNRAKWDDFYLNVKHFLLINNQHKFKINSGFITLIPATQKLTTKWMHNQFQELFKLADNYELRHPHNWAGEVDLNDERPFIKTYKLGCSMLMNQLVILPNGDVTVCCSDLNSKGVLDNILETSLYNIYNNKKRLHMVESLFNRKKHLLDLCKNCATY